MTIINIDTNNKTPEEAANEAIEEMKLSNPEIFERAMKRPIIKRTKKIITIGIDSNLSDTELHDLLKAFWIPLIRNGGVKNFVRSIIIQYEKLENGFTTIKGINNGSGWGEWYCDELLPVEKDLFK